MSDDVPEKQKNSEEPIPAVASVLSSDQVVLNIGREHKVRIGQRYLIYSLSDYEITDPVSDKTLGRVEIPKGTGEIVNVQEGMAVLESDIELSQSTRSGLGDALIGSSEWMNPARKAPFRTPRTGDRVKRIN